MVYMDSIKINGNVALRGTVKIQGSKNAALPVLAATILVNDISYIYNCPRISDVYCMINLLKSIGASVNWIDEGLYVDSRDVCEKKMPSEAIRGMRSSIFLLGALLGRCGRVCMEYPGGCLIGERPIDIHIDALKRMGVCFEQEGDILTAWTENLHGAEITLRMPSVGATENIILAAVTAEGDTTISNAAKEPEVVALCEYLSACGAHIDGVGSSDIKIKGSRRLYGVDYKIPTDRIVAGTYLFATVGTMGSVFLQDAPVEHMQAVFDTATRMGAQYEVSDNGVYVQMDEIPKAIPSLMTESYPGFPTDLQSVALVVLSKANGISYIDERIFENRFRILEPLLDMGAKLYKINDRCVKVEGVENLYGTNISAKELRGGAALTVAGLMAFGETIISDVHFIDRGYENICHDFRELGARITRV